MPLFSFAKPKRYLTGMDWMVHTLDYASKVETGVGNVSQIVLELQEKLDSRRFEFTLRKFLAEIPVVSGHCRRALNLAPYWYIPETARPEQVQVNFLEVTEAEDSKAIFEILTRAVNTPFPNEQRHVAFTLVHQEAKSYLAMQFDHRLLDARGAEMFLAELSKFAETEKTDIGTPCTVPAHLNKWKQKFTAGKHINRTFIALKDTKPPAAIALPPAVGKKRASTYHFLSYSREKTRQITDLADDHSGYLMTLPYLLGCATHAFHHIFKQKGITGSYVVPVNVDGRYRESGINQLFFNHVSFLFFKFLQDNADSLPDLWKSAGKQLCDNSRDQVSQNMAEASMLMRIVPLPILNKLMRHLCQGATASFAFSYISNDGFGQDTFMNAEVENIYHMPRVPPSPGTGIFFTTFKGKLNVLLSSLEGMLTPEECTHLMSVLDNALLDRIR